MKRVVLVATFGVLTTVLGVSATQAQAPAAESSPAAETGPDESPGPEPPAGERPEEPSAQSPAAADPAFDLPFDPATPLEVEGLTVVGTREAQTAGSAHILGSETLERTNQDNPEAVVKAVPGVYARGEDGFGLRPNVGIRGTNPDRSKKVTLMEDGILFGPAPYSAPAAYYFPLVTRMDAVRVIKGPGAVSFGPQTIAGAVDFVTRPIPFGEAGAIDLAGGQYGYGKLHAHFGGESGRAGYVMEGIHLRSDGFKEIDGGGPTGFSRNEWMWKGRLALPDWQALQHRVGLKLGYSDESSRETYLGLSDADFRADPYRRYASSRLDHMRWHRTQVVASYEAEWGRDLALEAAAYRHDFSRIWRKVNRMGGASITEILANPDSPRSAILGAVLAGAADSTSPEEIIYIGPNQRDFVSQGLALRLRFSPQTGPVSHRIETGARLHYDRIERKHSEDGFFMRGGRMVATGQPTLTTADGRAWTTALALHLTEAATWRWLTLTPGVRVELIDSAVRDRLAGREVDDETTHIVIPGAGAYLALSQRLGLLGGVYRGFSPAAPGQAGAVEPETSINYEAGARFADRRVRLEAIGFYNDYRNLTSICTFAAGCTSAQVDTQYDAGRARIYGVEGFASADLPLPAGWRLPFLGAYTFTKTRLLESFMSEDPTLGRVEAGDELPYVPRHQLNVTAGIEHLRGGLDLGGTYSSATREQAGQGPLSEGLSTDASFVLDLTARLTLGLAGEVYLHIRNLLGAEDLAAHRPFGARPIAPRWVQIGTRWRL